VPVAICGGLTLTCALGWRLATRRLLRTLPAAEAGGDTEATSTSAEATA
jgi:hypothetical protein